MALHELLFLLFELMIIESKVIHRGPLPVNRLKPMPASSRAVVVQEPFELLVYLLRYLGMKVVVGR